MVADALHRYKMPKRMRPIHCAHPARHLPACKRYVTLPCRSQIASDTTWIRRPCPAYRSVTFLIRECCPIVWPSGHHLCPHALPQPSHLVLQPSPPDWEAHCVLHAEKDVPEAVVQCCDPLVAIGKYTLRNPAHLVSCPPQISRVAPRGVLRAEQGDSGEANKQVCPRR